MIKKIDIIVPVYNEGELIVDTIKSIENNFNYSFNILICYDFDDDNTIKTIENSSLIMENIFFIKTSLREHMEQ